MLKRTIACKLDSKEVFFRHVKRTKACWEWTGCLSKKGYGWCCIIGLPQSAHRASWTIHNGKIPSGKHVLHKCDNRKCVRPSHLFIGTQVDNVADMDSKGRRASFVGTQNPRCKLTREQVIEIYLSDRAGLDIAKQYRIAPQTVSAIKSGQNWSHVTGARL